MGSAESSLSNSQRLPPDDEITTVSQRIEGVDPLLEKLQALRIAEPLLKSAPPTDGSLTDILVRKPSSSSLSGSLNPKVLLELFSMYRDWQEEKAKKISQKQEEIENKIEVADALAVKLFQRFNYSVSTMRTAAYNLAEVHPLQVEVGELKGRLTEVISNCDAMCRRISTEGPNLLQPSVRPFSSNIIERAQHDSEDAQSTSLDKD
ncbi:hypothetical protein Taro_033975 [Colocasia esculenta]|uniref:BLOC-1-related complex subunit 5 n=1 Tax=Colocasia esculenta TaxID=4460 RepID=A0A843W1L3_COLES|nr:hypothetical protein [Colocasia esculenta]